MKSRAKSLRESENALLAAKEATEQALTAVRKARKSLVKGPLKPPVNSREEHIRQHRSGQISKLDSDPELRAFVLERIDRLTYIALQAEIASHFPPERRVGKSAIHHWWSKRQHLHRHED